MIQIMQWDLTVVLIFILLMTSDVEYLFLHVLSENTFSGEASV